MTIPLIPALLACAAVLTISACSVSRDNESNKGLASVSSEQSNRSDVAMEKIRNTAIMIPETNETVQLTNGVVSFPIAPNSATKGVLQIHSNFKAIWDGEGRTELVTVLSVDNGGSGTFFYLMLFDITGANPVQKSQALLGDRVRVINLGIGELVHSRDANYRVSVAMLDRSKNQTMGSKPDIKKMRLFYVTDQKLEEIQLADGDV